MPVVGGREPCQCGSGLPQAVCHLQARDTTVDCPCGSGTPLVACHLIGPDDPRVFPYYQAHRKDYEVTRPHLATAYRAARQNENWPPDKPLRMVR